MISEIQLDIEKIEADRLIYDSANFNARTNALDFIDFHIIDRINSLIEQVGASNQLNQLSFYANRLKDRLENINTKMFDALAQQISNAGDKGLVMRKIIAVSLIDFGYHEQQSAAADYDNLDIFLNRILSATTVNEAKRALEPEMVFYQKTPARIIIAISKKINHDDVFFDIGCGVGQAVILVNLISGAKAIGIEFEPEFCNYGTEVALKLELKDTSFFNEDARNADYSTGTVFFLYTPFIGKMMQEVLVLLHQVSLKKEIRIFTYGPCSKTINMQKWLKCLDGNADNIYQLCEFTSFQI
ncbi:hypothetical protein ACVWYN_002400 [Pedobacter sp. UYP24]